MRIGDGNTRDTMTTTFYRGWRVRSLNGYSTATRDGRSITGMDKTVRDLIDARTHGQAIVSPSNGDAHRDTLVSERLNLRSDQHDEK